VALAHSGRNLAVVTDAAGFVRSFAYDGDHHAIEDAWGPRDVSYGYASGGLLTTADRGGGVAYSVTPAAVAATGNAAPDAPLAVVTLIGLGETTTSLLDTDGRVWGRTRADGTTEAWDRNGPGDVTTYQDPDGYLTGYGYDGAGDVTSIAEPDGSTRAFSYDATFHMLTRSWTGTGTRPTTPSTGRATPPR